MSSARTFQRASRWTAILVVGAVLAVAGCASTAPAETTRSASPATEPSATPLPEACRFTTATGASAPASVDDSFLPGTGVLRVLVLPVDFPDAPGAGDPTAAFAGGDEGATLVAQFSKGNLDVEFETHDQWTQMPAESIAYGLSDAVTYEEHLAYFTDALAAADPVVDFTGYGAVFVVASAGSSIAGASVFTADDSLVTGEGTIPFAAHFGDASVDPRTVAHETMHTIGLPDLYPYDPTTVDSGSYVGQWDIMGNTSGASPIPFAWQQWVVGWLADEQLACLETGSIDRRLAPVEADDGTKAVVVPIDATTAIVVESRRPDGSTPGACGSGVIVYRVDMTVASGAGPITVLGPRPPGEKAVACADLGDAVLSATGTGGGAPATWTDPTSGVSVEVLASDDAYDEVRVTR